VAEPHLLQRNVRNWVAPVRVTQDLNQEHEVKTASMRVCECADRMWVGGSMEWMSELSEWLAKTERGQLYWTEADESTG
jgi:hypothetical protein